jgi:alpha,alpha-trehalose phosphorylase
MDVDDLEHNTRDGLHMAALAGSWIALIAGFGGMRDTAGRLCFAPRLPERLNRLSFTLSPRRRRLHVEVSDDTATYSLLEGQPLDVAHHGEHLILSPGEKVVRSIPPAISRPRPKQPQGREPQR